ncbi:hypothetical protein [uncultured Cohaesibacter sp.]|uniref:hypothetical protein n=1 Tax=uncultured Cohaesibacter sp. TaxID=1002546 RepID=UPI002AA9365F|nr:hypothetical protein [uncultured Cohaesibacter sp.]
MKRASFTITTMFVLLLAATANGADWGFSTNSGDYITITRQPDGSLSGSLLYLDVSGKIETATITGKNVEAGKMTLRIPDYFGDREIKMIKGLEEGNATWRSDTGYGDGYGDIDLRLKGITNRSDELATKILQDWKGNTNQRIRVGTYAELAAYVEQEHGKVSSSVEPVSLVTQRKYAAFWDGQFSKTQNGASIRTFYDPSTDSGAVIATNSEAVRLAYAYADQSDGNAQEIVEEVKSNAYVIGGRLSPLLIMRIPTRSFFDDYYEEKKELSTIKAVVANIFREVSIKNKCTIIRETKKLGEIHCNYHSSEYNFRENSWMRTVIAFCIEDSISDGKRTLVWQPISYFAKGFDIENYPFENTFLPVSDKRPFRDIENAMLTRFFDSLTQSYKGSEINGWR